MPPGHPFVAFQVLRGHEPDRELLSSESAVASASGRELGWSPSGLHLARSSFDTADVWVWTAVSPGGPLDAESPRVLTGAHQGAVNGLAWAPTSSPARLATAVADGQVALWTVPDARDEPVGLPKVRRRLPFIPQFFSVKRLKIIATP